MGAEWITMMAVGVAMLSVAVTLGGLVLVGMSGLRQQLTELRGEVRADIGGLRSESSETALRFSPCARASRRLTGRGAADVEVAKPSTT